MPLKPNFLPSFQATRNLGATIFGIKDGGKCLVSEDGDDYMEDEPSPDCVNGEGADEVMNVYTGANGECRYKLTVRNH